MANKTEELRRRRDAYEKLLDWKETGNSEVATLGVPGDCVIFYLTYYRTCYRRGQHRLLVEICGGENHEKWGCFDDADQPERHYHLKESARNEAEEIARVLLTDRLKKGPLHEV
jgi:hypothetical protein